MMGLLPFGAAGFLCWVFVKSMMNAPPGQLWSVVSVVAAGVLMTFVARFVFRSEFFGARRESSAG